VGIGLVDDPDRLGGRGDVGDNVHVRFTIEDLADPGAHDGARLDDDKANGLVG
jgi:hypothetical protein